MGHSECCMSFQRVCTSRCCVNDHVNLHHCWLWTLTLDSKCCPVPDTRLSLWIRYHWYGTRAVLFSYRAKTESLIWQITTTTTRTVCVCHGSAALASCSPSRCWWTCGSARWRCREASDTRSWRRSRAGFHTTWRHCQATGSNFVDQPSCPKTTPRPFILLTS